MITTIFPFVSLSLSAPNENKIHTKLCQKIVWCFYLIHSYTRVTHTEHVCVLCAVWIIGWHGVITHSSVVVGSGDADSLVW